MSHPYISGFANIAAIIDQLRKSFPQTVDSSTIKKLGIAPKNESYVINCLQFLSIIDEDGKKTEEAGRVFSLHKDNDFQAAFSKMVEKAYHELHELHGDEMWSLSKPDLVTFFRSSDQTSDAIGNRQAGVFQVLANKSGKLEVEQKNVIPKKIKQPTTKKKEKPTNKTGRDATAEETPATSPKEFGFSIKVEINLPSDASAETYDNIFKSLRKNILDAG